MAEKKDRWDKADVILKGLWPILAFLLAFLYQQKQDVIVIQAKTAEHVAHLAEQLASSNQVAQKIALTLLREEKKRHPDEVPESLFDLVASQLVSGAVNSDDKQLAEEFKQTALALAPSADIRKAIESSTKETTPRVYIHHFTDSSIQLANQARDAMKSADITVPPDRLVIKGPRQNQLRYFKPEEESEARRIAAILESAHIEPLQVDFISGYENSTTIRPHHFELWLTAAK